MRKPSVAKVTRKKFDKNAKIWYHINWSFNIHNLFEKSLAIRFEMQALCKELTIYYAKCTICLPRVSSLLLGL